MHTFETVTADYRAAYMAANPEAGEPRFEKLSRELVRLTTSSHPGYHPKRVTIVNTVSLEGLRMMTTRLRERVA